MQSNPLLEEKYRIQRELVRLARESKQDYLKLVEAEARGFFEERGWPLRYADWRGGRLQSPSEPARQSSHVAESGAGYG